MQTTLRRVKHKPFFFLFLSTFKGYCTTIAFQMLLLPYLTSTLSPTFNTLDLLLFNNISESSAILLHNSGLLITCAHAYNKAHPHSL